ncbi:MAG TPA: hypothetical protein VMT88_11690, partial [Actinomycetes bacterium]|nr:hypothetical protein [Actinomycetes bacterium]
MFDWYQTHVVDTGRSAALWALIAFLVTYGLVRLITLRIRARQDREESQGASAIKDVYIGGVHIHHQVWGILLVLVVGLLEFRFRPESPWLEALAMLFGVGAALALDEFALWLHLEDVYWSEEGRKSIDAVMVAVVVGAALVVGASPIGVDAQTVDTDGLVIVTIAVVCHIAYTVVCLLKGKLATGLIGLPIPLLALVGAIRLAKPTSFWAKRYYKTPKLEKAEIRFGFQHQARQER